MPGPQSGRIAEAEGAAGLTLHARTADQLYSPHAHWGAISELVQVGGCGCWTGGCWVLCCGETCVLALQDECDQCRISVTSTASRSVSMCRLQRDCISTYVLMIQLYVSNIYRIATYIYEVFQSLMHLGLLPAAFTSTCAARC